jgi:DNA sulfur modification protein DndD
MKLQSITTRNFMPYKGEMHIDFPVDEFRNVMLVFGDNMRGKTSLLNAIRWGFYGRAVGRHSQTIGPHEIINKEAAFEDDWTFEVRIKFEADGHTYDLRRRAEKRATVSVPQRAEDFQIQVHLSEDGIPVQGDLIDAKINNIAPEQISRFFLFDGELLQEYETLLIEGSDQGRQIKEAIEQVLGVPALINGRDELGVILKAALKAQQQDLQRTKGSEKLAEQQASLIARQDSYEHDLQALVARLEMIKAERVALDDDIDASQAVYNSKIRLDSLTEQRNSIDALREQKRKDRLDLLGSAWRDLVELKISVRRDQLEAQRSELSKQVGNQAVARHQIAQLQELLKTDLCPTCKQDLSEDRRVEIGKELGRLEGELQNLRDTSDLFQELSVQIGALNKIRGSNVRDRLEQINRDLQNYEVQLTKIENEAEGLRDEIRGYDTAEIARKRSIRDEKLKEETRLQGDINSRRDEIKKIKDELAVNQKTIEGLSQNRSQRSTIKAQLCSQLEKIFNQSIERLRDRLRQAVQDRANEAFHELITQKSYRGLEINKNYGLSIVDDMHRHVTIRSAGAEQIVALSLIDGLNRTGRAAGPVVMDTPFGRLDPNHRDNILNYMPKATSQFVLLVHRGEIRPETDLASIAPRIGGVYQIREINSRHSVLERTTYDYR